MTTVAAFRTIIGDLVMVGVEVRVDNKTIGIYVNAIPYADNKLYCDKINMANSTAMCCVMAIEAATGKEVDLITID